jgi:hypothetical protein
LATKGGHPWATQANIKANIRANMKAKIKADNSD